MLYRFKELATIKYGKSQKAVIDECGSIPIYGTGGLMGYATKPLYEKPSMIIGRKGTIDKVRYMDKAFWTVDTAFYTEINERLILPRFFYYKMCCVDLMQLNEGTSIPSLRAETLNRMEFDIPPLPTQHKIAAVLSSLDDKIELNRQINANLEQQAQAIFKNWFVDFEPFGGQMPAGWREGKLSEILAEIETGKRENGGALSCGVPSIGAEKIENITHYDFSSEKYISPDFYQKMQKGKIKSGDVLLYKDGAYTGKSTMFLNDFPYNECAVNEHVFLLRTEKSKHQCFLYLLISQDDIKTYLHTMASSKAAQPGLNKTELQSVDIIIPTNDVLDKFEEIIYPLFNSIISGLQQSRTLANIRDTLLPKLMSGELKVN